MTLNYTYWFDTSVTGTTQSPDCRSDSGSNIIPESLHVSSNATHPELSPVNEAQTVVASVAQAQVF